MKLYKRSSKCKIKKFFFYPQIIPKKPQYAPSNIRFQPEKKPIKLKILFNGFCAAEGNQLSQPRIH